MPVFPAIKFCGLTRIQDVREAANLRVEYIGLVFAVDSPRRVSIEVAKKLADEARDRDAAGAPRVVALFRNASPDLIEQVIIGLEPDILQFHGDEQPPDCERYGLPYWKALGMGDKRAAFNVEPCHPNADALLLDAHETGGAGGTGQSFDWRRWPSTVRRLVLAGGLRPDNVAVAIAATRPFAVDVSSGIESEPRTKDPERMRAFILAVRSMVG